MALVWYQMDGKNNIKVPEVIDIVLGQYNYVLVPTYCTIRIPMEKVSVKARNEARRASKAKLVVLMLITWQAAYDTF